MSSLNEKIKLIMKEDIKNEEKMKKIQELYSKNFKRFYVSRI